MRGQRGQQANVAVAITVLYFVASWRVRQSNIQSNIQPAIMMNNGTDSDHAHRDTQLDRSRAAQSLRLRELRVTSSPEAITHLEFSIAMCTSAHRCRVPCVKNHYNSLTDGCDVIVIV